MKAAEVVKVFKVAKKEFFEAIKKIDVEATNKKKVAFEVFNDDLQQHIKDADIDTILEVLEDKNLADKQRALIAAAYASNHEDDEFGFLASLLGLFIIS